MPEAGLREARTFGLEAPTSTHPAMRAAANPKSSEDCALGGMGAFPDVAPPLAHAMPAPKGAPPLAHAMPAPRGAPHGWGEEEEPAFAAARAEEEPTVAAECGTGAGACGTHW